MKKIHLYIFVVIVLTLSSCSYYNPISTNVPSYEKKGEVNLGVSLGTSADVQISTNPIEHLSIIGSASTSGSITNESGRDNIVPDSLRYNFSRNQFELGLGYYYMLTDNIQHDFHVGYGFGSAAKRENFWNGFDDDLAYRADVNIFFIQSSLVVKIDEDVKGYLSSKFNYLTIGNYEQSKAFNTFNNSEQRFIEEQYWLNQLGIGLIADLGPLQLHAQGQINFRFTNELFVDERFMGLYLGVNFNISDIVTRIKEQ